MLTNEKLIKVRGGTGGSYTSSSGLNAIARLITTILELGRVIGSNISRFKNKNYC